MAADHASIKSLAASIVFTVLYFLLFVYFIVARPGPVRVYIIIVFFCAVRVAAFILRALLASVPSDAGNLHMLIAYEILYNTSFFGLLYFADTLITARAALARVPPRGFMAGFLSLPFLFPIALVAAVAISIAGTIQSGFGTTQSIVGTGNTLCKAAIYIFLGCSIFVFLRTCFLPPVKPSGTPSPIIETGCFGSISRISYTRGIYIILVISLLLLAREVFFTVTVNNTSKQNKEAFWYPLSVVTEFIVVVLSATPGLMPDTSNDQMTSFPLT